MKHTLPKIAIVMVICLFSFFTSCQKDDSSFNENQESHSYKPKLVSIDEVLAIVKNDSIKNKIKTITQKPLQKNVNDSIPSIPLQYFEKIELYDYTQYSLYLSKREDDLVSSISYFI